MSDFSRRDFLKASAGAVGASLAAHSVHAAPKAAEGPPKGAKIFTVFGLLAALWTAVIVAALAIFLPLRITGWVNSITGWVSRLLSGL